MPSDRNRKPAPMGSHENHRRGVLVLALMIAALAVATLFVVFVRIV
jgi:hypothetical protein